VNGFEFLAINNKSMPEAMPAQVSDTSNLSNKCFVHIKFKK